MQMVQNIKMQQKIKYQIINKGINMRNKMEKIESLVEQFMYEADEEEEVTEAKSIEIFYSDLDMDGKQKVLEAIDESFEYVDVFSDDIVRENIEEGLSKRPLLTMTAEELINKMDIEL